MQTPRLQGRVLHSWNSGTQKVEEGGSEIQGQPGKSVFLLLCLYISLIKELRKDLRTGLFVFERKTGEQTTSKISIAAKKREVERGKRKAKGTPFAVEFKKLGRFSTEGQQTAALQRSRYVDEDGVQRSLESK